MRRRICEYSEEAHSLTCRAGVGLRIPPTESLGFRARSESTEAASATTICDNAVTIAMHYHELATFDDGAMVERRGGSPGGCDRKGSPMGQPE